MKRTYILSSDNTPIEAPVSITTSDASGTYHYSTLSRVTWAAITYSDLSISVGQILNGPYFYTPLNDTTVDYNIRSFNNVSPTALFSEGMLQVYLNGQLLERGTDGVSGTYEEVVDGSDYYQFKLINIGTYGLEEIPKTTDTISISFGSPHTDPVIAGALSGSESLNIIQVYPAVDTGFTVSFSGFAAGAKTINFNVLYR